MKICSINLKNWKSYDELGIKIDNLKKINIIIGPNNSGKSNIFKYFYHLREIIDDVSSKVKDKLQDYGVLNNVDRSFDTEYTWAWKNEDITCEIELNKDDIKNTLDISDYLSQSEKIIAVAKHFQKENRSRLYIIAEDNQSILEDSLEKKPKVYNCEEKAYVNMVEELKESFDTYNIWNNFKESLVFIDPIRHINRNSTLQDEECDFNGCNLKDEIYNLDKNRVLWVDYKRKMKKWLEEILGEDKFEPSVKSDGKIAFSLKKGTEEIEAYFKDLGTGVSQIFMILSYLFINKSKKLNVFIEEPECNLHPDAVVRLIQILENEFTNHTFFITTHSSMLIDQLDKNWSINRVLKKENQASVVHSCNTIIDKYEILDELGIRASQILQSNYIIWIEGPSDRVYINKWIEIFSNGLLKEGIHYSFLMYGGSNLTTYNLLEDENCIDLLATSRYVTIVCDSDRKDKDSELKKRVQNLKERLSELSKSENGYDRNISDYVDLWITDGREIENYIKEGIFVEILFKGEFVKKFFQKKGKSRENLKYDNSIKKDFNKFESFDKYFATRYIKDNGEELTDEEIENISNHYSNNKVDISKEVVKKLDQFNSDCLDLEDKMNKLISKIKIANGVNINNNYKM